MVEAQKPTFHPLWGRMAKDLELYRLKPYDGHGNEWGSRRAKGLQTYTSNEPQVVANKLISTVSESKIHLSVSTAREVEEQRMANQASKDFLMSAFRMADERLDAYVEPYLIEQMATHVVLRGWCTGRSLLRRDVSPIGEETTMVDITPWDPMNVVWEKGKGGLSWACHISSMTYAEIKAAFPEVQQYDMRQMHSTDRFTVYDLYDQTFNLVFADGLDIKTMTPHGASKLPVYVTFTRGEVTRMSSEGQESASGLEYMGESCYQSNRMTYDEINFGMSVRKQTLAQAERRSVIYESQDGRSTLEKSPYQAGAEINIKPGEKISTLDMKPLGPDPDHYHAMITGEAQRGGLPYTAYGTTPISLSGTALQGLRDDYKNQATPFVKAVQKAMQRIADNLIDQYSTGRFSPLSIPGQMDESGPMLVQMSDPVQVKLLPNYPMDFASAAATAQIVKETGLMSEAQIRSDIMHLQDEEGIQDVINVERASAMNPTVQYMTALRSAIARGEEEIANELMTLYMAAKLELEGQLAMMQMEMASMGLNPQGGEGGQGGQGGAQPIPGGGMRGVSPRTAPQQSLGMSQPRQPGQSGPLIEPGRPRPGAQGRDRSRLLQ